MDHANDIAPSALTVFYDGGCPLCLREIGFYRRREGAERIAWIDVSDTAAQLTPGLNRCDALARFHVMDANGAYFSGGDAFAKLWAALPAFRLLGRAAQTGPFKWLLNAAYAGFLPIRPHLQKFAMRLEGKRPETR